MPSPRPSRRSRPRAPSWDTALSAFRTHLTAQAASPLTLRDYTRAVEHLRHQLESRPLATIALADLRHLQVGLLDGSATRSGAPLSATSVRGYCVAWRRFFGFLADEALLPFSPADRLESPRKPRQAPGRVLKQADLPALFGAADLSGPGGLRDRALVELLYATGLRRAEAVALDLSDLSQAERELHVRRGKGGHGRRVPIVRSAWGRLERYLAEGRPELVSSHEDGVHALFLGQSGKRLHPDMVGKILARLSQRAGLAQAVAPHDLRRSCATHLLQGGASLRHIQLLLGHKSLATTSVYLNLDPGELRREVLLKHPRERME